MLHLTSKRYIRPKARTVLLGAQTYTPTVQNSATTPPPAKIDPRRASASSGNGFRDLGSLRTSAGN